MVLTLSDLAPNSSRAATSSTPQAPERMAWADLTRWGPIVKASGLVAGD
jgi:hypothetical protein